MNSRMWMGLCVSLFVMASSLSAGETRTLSVAFDRHTLRAEQYYLGDETYDLVTISDLDLTREPGHPALPVKAINLYVPRGSRIERITLETGRSYELPTSYYLLPAQPEMPLSSAGLTQPAVLDEYIYSLAQPYPDSPVAISATGSIAGRKISSILVFPLQYVPAEGKVIFNEEIRFNVEFGEAATEPVIPKETPQVRRIRNGIVQRLVENPYEVEWDFPQNGGTLDPSAASEYLITCIANHADEYELLKYWKTRKGIPAAIKTLDQIFDAYPGRDDQEKIRNCIKDYYLNQSTAWVVITLSAPKARIRGCYCEVDGYVEPFIPCDLYFADMDGDWNQDGDEHWGELTDDVDLYPDVWVGRLPENTGIQCSTVVHKILTYEGYYSVPADYQLDMLFMAEYTDTATNDAVLKDMIDSESVPARFDPITKLYASSGNLNRTTAMNALNSGMGLINHAGHGWDNKISIAGLLTSDDMLALTNAPRYSVFYTLACSPGNFGNIAGFFGRAFVESPNGGGFFVGNSRAGFYWSGHPGYGTGDIYDREFFKSIFVRGYTHLGVVHADHKIVRIPYSGSYCTDRYTQYSMNLFGDPETPIWKDTPIEVVAYHTQSLEVGNHSVDVTVEAQGSPLAAARVCLWMGDAIYMVDETDGSGSATFQISPADSGTILVTVTKNGYVPYLGEIEVTEDLSGTSAGNGLEAGVRAVVTPNPAMGAARIGYRLPQLGSAALNASAVANIYDASGKLMRSLPIPSGSAHGYLIWDGRLASGKLAPPGIYFLKVTCANNSSTAKFVIVR